MLKNKIIWEKWVDPFYIPPMQIPTQKEQKQEEEWASYPEYEDYEEEQEEDDEQDEESMLLLYSEMGVIPYNEQTSSAKIFNFWIGHTNFGITEDIKKKIEQVAGIEILDVFTRYRFRIAIGKAFTDRDVMNSISAALSKG